MNFLFFASYGAIFLRAFQQKNVMRNKYWAVPIATLGMAVAEVFVVTGVIQYGASWVTVANISAGSTLGCWSGMYLHNKIFRG